MNNFRYNNSTTIIFGKNTQAEVEKETKKYGKKILLHYGGGSIKKGGLYDEVVKSLDEAYISFIELGGVQPNPRLSLVEEGIRLCKQENLDFILAVGGGSVIDSAKAIAIGAKTNKYIWDFFNGNAKVEDALPVGVVLTIPAAGSESSTSCVITNEEGWLKRSTGSLIIRPKFAIMNPELTFSLPPYQTACGAADMLAHVMERYFTTQEDVSFTDALCEATMQTILRHTKVVLKETNNYASRAELMWAGSIAHNGLLGTGRVEDWASHAIEHELSGIYDIAHGAGLAIVFPAWMKYVYKTDVRRFAHFAHRVFGIQMDLFNLDKMAIAGIEALEKFFKEIGLPTRLIDASIDDSRLEEMAKKASQRGLLGSFMKLTEEDVLQILKLALK